MKFNDKIIYSTGEFAAYFGIKKDTLLYYDKINLFRPAGIRSNGYRYYTASQIAPFRTLLSMRELNVPINKLLPYFQNPSAKKLSDLTTSQLTKIDEEISKLTQIQLLLKQLTDSVNEGLNAEYGKVLIVSLSDTYLLYSKQTVTDPETSEEQWADIHNDFIMSSNIPGSSNVGSILSENDLKNKVYNHINRLFTEGTCHTGRLRKGGTYAVYYHKGLYSHMKHAYSNMFRQINELGYIPVGDAYEEYLIAGTASANEEEYVTKITINVKGSCQ